MSQLSIDQPFFEQAGQIALRLPGATAIFTTRRGGSSQGPYEALNLGILTDDAPQRVTANHDWLAQTFGVRLAYGKQVHGADVRVVDAPTEPIAELIAADALVTVSAGLAPLVFAADCLPIVVAGGGGLATIHAGWPGLAKGVIGNAVASLREQLGAAGVEVELVAAVGPSAGVCCYEVGDDLHERFTALGYSHRSGRNLDLKAIAHQQLSEAGVTTIHDLGICTICSDHDQLFSHRRDHGVTGRQGAFAWLS